MAAYEPKGSAQVGAFGSRAGGAGRLDASRGIRSRCARAEAAAHIGLPITMKDQLEAFLEHLRAERERLGAHRPRLRKRSRAVRHLPGGASSGRRRSDLVAGRLRSSAHPRASSATCTSAATRDRRRRASSRRSGRSADTCGARGDRGRSGGARRHAEARAPSARASRRGGDGRSSSRCRMRRSRSDAATAPSSSCSTRPGCA